MATAKRRRARSTGLIKSYGVYWRKDEVKWQARRGGLWGNRRRKNFGASPHVNFWHQAGVYILYDDRFDAVYSGQTTCLGRRLRNHTRHMWLGPKWAHFSWFGIRQINAAGDGMRRLNMNYGGSARVVLDTMEAMLIAVGARTENKQGPKLHSAVPFYQVPHEHLGD